MLQRRSWMLGVAMLALAGTGCARGSRTAAAEDGAAAGERSAMLVVKNNNPADVDVSVVEDAGVRRRLGMVRGGSTRRFPLDWTLLAPARLAVVATPIGGGGLARSGVLLVIPGETITFTVEPELSTSFATVR
jgi:hypothetical protein